MLHEKSENGTIFAIGSSGSNMRWRATGRKSGLVDDPPEFPPIGPAEKMIVISGSAAANTAEQINYAWRTAWRRCTQYGPPGRRDGRGRRTQQAIREALAHLGAGRDPCCSPPSVRTSRSSEDRGQVRELGIDQSETGKMIARQQGLILRALLEGPGSAGSVSPVAKPAATPCANLISIR